MLDLDLSNNKIRGEIPDWLWRLPQLNVLNLSHNSFSSFHGSLEGFPATVLVSVDISSNMFQGPLFVPSRYLGYLSAKGNHFSGEIPESICASGFMSILDLSNNSFTGSIPWCLRNLQSLVVLNLGHNHLSGSFPDMFTNGSRLESLDVSHNRLGGKLPKSLINCTRLEILNVGSNRIRDSFPLWLRCLQELQVLVLSSNEFHGTIYGLTELPFGFPKLRVIDISHNQFFGALPSGFFVNLKAMVRVGPTENGSESMYMQADLGYYHDSIVLTNKGVQVEYTRILTVLTAIDFSGNRLHGEIPQSIGLLKDLRALSLSNNAFSGHVPASLTNLTKLESLDLSRNELSGKIPPQLGSMWSLAYMNFSNNRLEGPIPQGPQFDTQERSSFEHNLGLCGPPLGESCGEVKIRTMHQPEEKEETLSWKAAVIGFAPGLFLGVVIQHVLFPRR